MSSARQDGGIGGEAAGAPRPASRPIPADSARRGGDEPTALHSRIAELEAELARLRDAEQVSRQREQQLTQHNLVLVNLSRSAAIEAGDLESAFQEITLAAAHTLDVERTSIWLFSADRSAIRCADLYQRKANSHGDGLEFKAVDIPAYFRALEDNRTLAADNAQTDPRTREFDATYLKPLGITSMLDAPVRRGGKLIGIICHEHVGPPRAWSLEDQAFAGSMADFVSLTLQAHDRAEALKAVRGNEKQLRQLIDLVPQMILAKDARGQILLCNKAVADAYGTSVERLIGRIQWDVHPRLDEAAAMLSDDLRVIEIGQERVVAEEHFTDNAGRTRILQTTKIPFMFAAAREPAVLGVSIDITQRKHDEHARELMVQELDHRVKNNLAVVMSIAEQTARGAKSMEAFAEAFNGRLRALAITHEMLAGAKWEGADLRTMATRLAEPYARADGQQRVVIQGENLSLPTNIAPSVCMILHELATNAAKHGALSNPHGRITVTWQREMRHDGDRRIAWLKLEWEERGGPPVKLPQRAGFGATFIEQTAVYQLRGRAHIDYKPGGLAAVLDLPLDRPQRWIPPSEPILEGREAVVARPSPDVLERAPAMGESAGVGGTGAIGGAGSGEGAVAETNANGRRVLVVEDDLLVAQSIAGHLRSLGCSIVGPVGTSEDACALVKSSAVDAAILDINLSAGTSAPVARALAGRNTPFVFVTGYSNLKTLPDDLRGQRVLCKPVDQAMLGRALREMAGV